MRNLSLATVGAVCALVAVAGFLLGVVLMISSGVGTLIPETGEQAVEWIADIEDASDLFFVGAWLGIFAGLFLLVALAGFYDALREAAPVMIVAPIAGAVGMTLVTISHVIPVAMAYELAPDYSEATGATQDALAVTGDAFFAGWLGLLAPASNVIEDLTTIGFLGFFVFMASMGIAILLRRKRSATQFVSTAAV